MDLAGRQDTTVSEEVGIQGTKRQHEVPNLTTAKFEYLSECDACTCKATASLPEERKVQVARSWPAFNANGVCIIRNGRIRKLAMKVAPCVIG